jgi:hypothetical protein
MDTSVNERWGHYAEWTARIAFTLTKERATYYDARDEQGRPVEVKACQRRIRRGDLGKYFIREANHQELRDAGGFYVFVVYDPENWKQGPILNMEIKPAAWLDTVEPLTWTGNGSRRGEIVKRPTWRAVFSPEDIPDEDTTPAAEQVASEG